MTNQVEAGRTHVAAQIGRMPLRYFPIHWKGTGEKNSPGDCVLVPHFLEKIDEWKTYSGSVLLTSN